MTFVTWKGASKQVTLFFKKYKVFKPAFNWLSQYLMLCPNTPLDAPLFVRQDGKPITQKLLQLLFISAFMHAIDHTLWYLLTVSTHSMQIGGVTIRIVNDVPLPTIQDLFRWSSASVYKYTR